MSDDELRAEVPALRALVADKETIAAVQMSAFEIGGVIINALDERGVAGHITKSPAGRPG